MCHHVHLQHLLYLSSSCFLIENTNDINCVFFFPGKPALPAHYEQWTIITVFIHFKPARELVEAG